MMINICVNVLAQLVGRQPGALSSNTLSELEVPQEWSFSKLDNIHLICSKTLFICGKIKPFKVV